MTLNEKIAVYLCQNCLQVFDSDHELVRLCPSQYLRLHFDAFIDYNRDTTMFYQRGTLGFRVVTTSGEALHTMARKALGKRPAP